jgi:RNA polymerase sigma-70 factor (sigma-E family)
MTRLAAPPALDDFVRSRHTELLRFAHVLSGDPYLAADLVQDALERTGPAWRRVMRQDDPEGYVRRTILNCFLNSRRAPRRERLVDQVPEHGREDREPRDDQLWRHLATLPRQQRAVIVLRYYLDFSEAQIAEELGCSVGTVKSRAARAMSRLRQAMAESTVEGGTR